MNLEKKSLDLEKLKFEAETFGTQLRFIKDGGIREA